ncbi:hypothetical protein DLM78_02120 [Leptospira stimsonii]|uniref:Uncharacterized protein n=1 Tax=Leptospira stimsonii TaxID=2202203 RepID=A0A8B3CY58_9LEPT|nr:hypothetical protein DLM78_02120 [Leptospira stimsonii]
MNKNTKTREKIITKKRSKGTIEKRIFKKEVITPTVSRNDWMDWDRLSKLVFRSEKNPVI